jgi:hypothetical protein
MVSTCKATSTNDFSCKCSKESNLEWQPIVIEMAP